MSSGDDPDSFEERLRSARARQGLDKPRADAAAPGFSPWGIGLRVGTELVAALAVGLLIGWGLDRWLGTSPLLLCVFVLLGGAAGVANIWRLMMPPSSRPK